MAEDKRIRITADTSSLRQIREEALSLYRDIDQASSLNSQEAERNLQLLREQLALMEDRNDLEKLLIELKKQATALDNQSNQNTARETSTSIPKREEDLTRPERRPVQEPTPRREESSQEVRPHKKPSITVDPVFDEETNSITWEVETPPSPVQEAKKPKKRKKKEDPSEMIPEEGEDGSVVWRKPDEKAKSKPVEKETSKEILREINRHVENIDNSVTNINNSRHEENNQEDIVNNSRHEENNQEDIVNNSRNSENITENIQNISRSVENITENTSELKEKDPVEVTTTESGRFREIIRETQNPIEERERKEPEQVSYRTPSTKEFSDENIIKAINSVQSAVLDAKRDINQTFVNVLKEFQNQPDDDSSTLRYLDTIATSLSLIEDNVDKIGTQIVDVRGRRSSGGEGGGSSILPLPGGGAGGGITGLWRTLGALGILSYVNRIKNVVAERYFRNQEFGLRSEYQGSVETAANYKRVQAANEADAYRWIPLVGDIIAKGIELPANIAADKLIATVQKAIGVENRNVLYTQTFGGTAGSSWQTAFREGSYAADALGIDVGSYSQRRAELSRAAGGRPLGGTGKDPLGNREAQSTMAAERLYGLSSNAVNQLQGALRFGDENASYGSSAIIRSFERTMKDLRLPFTEIASTMEESLSTFTKRADEILSKSGEFDAGRITAIMNAVRAETGLKGRQLERVQTAFTGSGIAEDDVTQALLLRTLEKTNPDISSYSQAMAELEKVRSGNADTEFMRSFLMQLQDLTQNNEQFINILKEVFPNLSWQDITSTFNANEGPDNVINRILDKVKTGLTALRERPSEAYSPTEARGTVGPGTRLQAGDTNRQAGIGGKSIGDVYKILQEIRDNTGTTANNTSPGSDQRGKGTYFDKNGPIYDAAPMEKDANKPEIMKDIDKAVERAIIRGFNKLIPGKITIPEERE